MIDYIKGEVADITPTSATLEAYGVGYQMNISLNTYGAISDKKSVKLYVYESIREDTYQLFGFVDKHERELFILLISVSGVGPSTARVILSSIGSKELESVIASENATVLQTVKGIGAKTAQRIIVDLKDKIKFTDDSGAIVSPKGITLTDTGHAAVSALVMLGFVQTASQKIVSKLTRSP